MQPHVILLNGPAGVGKTTIGRQLALLASDGVCIGGDAIRLFVIRRTSPHVQAGMAYVNGAKLAANYLHAGYARVVFEFVFEHRAHVHRFLDAFDAPYPVHLFTLWAPLETVIAREQARPDRDRLGGRVEACYRAIEAELANLGAVIRNDGQPPDAVARRIVALCEQGVALQTR